MFTPRPYSIFKQTPDYREAFEEGYKTAKAEMIKYLTELESLKTQTITFVLPEDTRPMNK